MKNTTFNYKILIVIFLCSHFPYTFASQDSLKDILKKKEILAHQKLDTAYINSLNRLAANYFFTAPDSVLHFSQKARELSETFEYKYGEAESIRFSGIAYYVLGEYDKALDLYKKSIEIFNTIEDLDGLASNYNNIAIIYDIRGEYEKSLIYNYKSLEIEREKEDTKGIAYSMINIGLTLFHLGRYSEAIDIQLEALKLNEKIGDQNGIALAFNNIAVIYSKLQKHDEAIEAHLKAKEIRKEINDLRGVSNSLYNVSLLLIIKGKYDASLQYLLETYEIAKKLEDQRQIALIYDTWAKLFYHLEDYPQAIEKLEKSMQLAESMKIKPLITNIKLSYSLIHFQLENYEKAKNYGYKAMQIANETGNKDMLLEVYLQIANIYREMNRFEDAYSYLNKHLLIKNKLNNQELQQKSARLDAEYNFYKKEQVLLLKQKEMEYISRNRQNLLIFISTSAIFIAILLFILVLVILRSRKKIQRTLSILKIKNQKIALQAQELEKADNLKNKLLSIISHDLRGPLSFSSAALDMIISGDIEKEEIPKYIPEIKQSVDSSYQLMENLLEWSKVQITNKDSKKTWTYPRSVCNEIKILVDGMARKKKLKINNNIPSEIKLCADKNLVELILRNLVTNAIKFSHSESEININAEEKKDDQKVIISVMDYGVGMDEEEKNKLFSDKKFTKKGTQNEPGSGLGLMLAKEMIEKNRGRIWVESTKNKGSVFYFSLPE